MSSPSIALSRESERNRVNVTLGMVLFIGSWSMAFGTLFLSFVVLRQRMPTWPPQGIELPSLPLAILATLTLIASSIILSRAVRLGAEGRPGFARLWLGGSALGIVFLVLQAGLWLDLMAAQRFPESGLFESLFYGLTWVHAAHVVAGLLGLFWAQVGIATGRYGRHHISTVGNAAIFWHFVDAVWILLFLSFFVF